MSGADPSWKILSCPHCEGLMKIDGNNPPPSLACPSCGEAFDDEPSEPEPDLAGGVEVISSQGGRVPAETQLPKRAGLPDPLEAALDAEIGSIPDAPTPANMAGGGPLPAPRPRQEFSTSNLISNIGEKPQTPREKEHAPKLDASRIISTEDERLAPKEEAEVGAIKGHVAREITGWDIDEKSKDDRTGNSITDQLKGRVGLIGIGIVSVLFVGLIAYGVFQSMREKVEVVKKEEKAPEEIAREGLTGLERDALDNSKVTFANAGKAIENFLSAPTYTERLAFVRDPERVKPLMEEFYSRNPDGPFAFRPPEDGWKMHPYNTFLLTNVVAQDFSPHPVAVERHGDEEEFRVDWESFVAFCEIPWEEIVERKSTTPFLVRGRASVALYYNYGYSDTEWASIKLQDRDQIHTIYGYVKLDDPVLQDLSKMMNMRGTVHITLRIVHPGGKKAANQFEVTEAVARGWVFSEDNGKPGAEGDEEKKPPEEDESGEG